jgi:hypothetical protein
MAQDEGRFGRISRPRACWAPPGVRPTAPSQLVREFVQVFAAVAPQTGELLCLILPTANTAMMNLFLAYASQSLSDSFIVMQLDQAGWHHSRSEAGARQHPSDRAAVPQSGGQSGRASVGGSARKVSAQVGLFLPRSAGGAAVSGVECDHC